MAFGKCALLALCGALAVSAHAQVQQTPEGAHTFLSQAIDRSLSKFAVKTTKNNYWRSAGVKYYAKLKPCSSQIDYQYPDAPDPIWVGTIDWGALGEVEVVPGASGNNAVRFVFKEREFKFEFTSSDMATRFAYAATFLRDSCDPTAQTGF